MSQVNGQLSTCERCGAQVFRRCSGEGEADGGYTRWNTFEPYPEGWGLVDVPKSVEIAHNCIRVCPDCQVVWDNAVMEHFLKGTAYYKKKEV